MFLLCLALSDQTYLALVIRVALSVPDALGILEDQIGTRRIQRKYHVISNRMRSVAMNGCNLETEFGQSEGRPRDAGNAMSKSCHGPILECHGLLGAVIAR